MANSKDRLAWSRLPAILYLHLLIAAGMAALGAMGFSRASGQGGSAARESGSPAETGRKTEDTRARQQSRVFGQRVEENAFSSGANKIARWVLEHTANGERAEFMVVLADQADLSGAAVLRTKNEKGRFVYDALWNKSQATQRPILQWLHEHGIEHHSFYIVNAILVKATRDIVEALAARPDVGRIEGNPHIQNDIPQPVSAVETTSQPKIPATIELGIAYTHAPDVWALGFTGQGIVVAGADTGQRWTHNALKPHYRGWDGQNANHDYNWHDSIHDSIGNNPCGIDSPVPCDDNGHGTHTTGTAVATMGPAIRLEWRPARNGSVAVTWTRGTARRQGISSAWSSSLRRIP